MENSGGWGSTTDPLEWKFQGGGRLKLNDHPWGGYGYFLETDTISDTRH